MRKIYVDRRAVKSAYDDVQYCKLQILQYDK